MHQIDSKFKQINDEIVRLTAQYQRPADSVRLIAVSKQHSADKVVALARLGQRDLAENYLQDAIEKIERVTQTLPEASANPLCWHFIGHVQSRKCQLVAENFDWVHSVDSIKIADKLNQHRHGAPLNVLIQLNLQAEESKFGVSERELLPLARAMIELPNLVLRGLMIIPKAETDMNKQRAAFRRCRELRDGLNSQGFDLDHLSMGMTADMEAAIAEGASMVRIGTALFGARPGQ